MNTDPTDASQIMAGDKLTLTIDKMAAGGDGVARVDGLAVFVANAAPGDNAEVEITHRAKNFARAKISSLLTPGPARVTPPCPLAGRCDGCQLQQLDYAAQLDAKRDFVSDGLARIGRLNGIEVKPTLGMENPWQYRNKAEFIAGKVDGKIRLGYHIDAEDGFLPLDDCPIQHPLSLKLLHAVEEVANTMSLSLAQLITRVNPKDNTALIILVCREDHTEISTIAATLRGMVPELSGVLFSLVRGNSVVRRTQARIISGLHQLKQYLGEWEYTVSAESFFQVNNTQAELLQRLAIEASGDLRNANFIDGYCGVGTFLLPLGKLAAHAMGIEDSDSSIRDAVENLARYTMREVHLSENRVEAIFPRMVRKGRKADVVLLDPPRKGAGPQVLESVAALKAKRVILISCDPATLGRDAGDLVKLGYSLQSVQPVDMFPQTWHVETIALAVKK